MTEIFISADSLITPFGIGSELAFEKIKSGESAVKKHSNPKLSQNEFYAALIQENEEWFFGLNLDESFTRLEKLIILCLKNLLSDEIKWTEKTLVVLSSTKGNISVLENPEFNFPNERALLTSLTRKIENYFELKNPVQIISNACISGALAIEFARRLLQSDSYENAIVIGADEVSKFILSGFESFQAVSDSVCKPFDRDRNGINLGEAIAAVYLTKIPTENSVKILGSGTFNDANHISGPSRTGEGLFRSIQKALENSEVEIDFISAHGTATLYNDEMESIAFHRSGLSEIPANSLKACFGHTLGASGLLETILSIHSLKNNLLIPSLGFENQGTTYPINLIRNTEEKELKTFLKTASGFGGSNIASVFEKFI
ncbi:beta-ketoacyl synthase N-terminal-like domain-containing protein [Moheibacter sp.]|uniref:beta-ketoacyl synthase N-terminal-like domain-containing protein n=1 Tax=Moheibacter sp. TaxID=1965316 RepID=UPI003C740556